MISLVVPTRNRAYTLRLVIDTYLSQECVDELIFVLDASEDASYEIITQAALGFPNKSVQCLINDTKRGAAYSRNRGVSACKNDYVLFCDDDEYLQEGYAKVCLQKLHEYGAAAVSGRRVYMEQGETQTEALIRFGSGTTHQPPFDIDRCEYNNDATFSGDIIIPYTNAIILTRRSLLLKFKFDETYSRGDGYREETDYQMRLFTSGEDTVMTNDVHSIHLPLEFVTAGGQRTSAAKRLFWRIYYTNYFLAKYHENYCRRLSIRNRRGSVLVAFAAEQIRREFASFMRRRMKLLRLVITPAR